MSFLPPSSFVRAFAFAFPAVLAFGVLGSSAACSYDNDTLRGDVGPAPVINALVVTSTTSSGQANAIEAPSTGPCCTFAVRVTYTLPSPDFVARAEVTFAEENVVHVISLSDPINVIDAGPDGAVDAAALALVGPTRAIPFDIDFPSQLVVTGSRRHDFTVVLVSGRGERSQSAAGQISVL